MAIVPRGARHLAAALIALTIWPVAAAAQEAPPPIGYWTTERGDETLYVSENGLCKYEGPSAGILVVGNCSWQATSRGGILTIVTTGGPRPAPVYYNIVWINQTTISVWGDIFYRRA